MGVGGNGGEREGGGGRGVLLQYVLGARLDGGFLKERFAVSTPSQCERSVATRASDFASKHAQLT